MSNVKRFHRNFSPQEIKDLEDWYVCWYGKLSLTEIAEMKFREEHPQYNFQLFYFACGFTASAIVTLIMIAIKFL